VKPVRVRPLAEDDLIEGTRSYAESGGVVFAGRFFDAAVEALRSVEVMPGIGSPTVGDLTGIDGLRRIGVEGFRCDWFYLERGEHLDVIRLLADRQDLETLLGDVD
jgi:toxin ParE1/3/4